ncbi:MAG TPA: serine/threonine-protein kinase [Vicinamibacteria bacterium]|nr:serine/threonine-protein kinase [Vicinamibacteria bacterium]
MQPQRIGKYEVTGKLGQGAMGEVFRAHDPVLSRDVAVKRISAGLDTDETVRKRFRREAEAAAKLNHPNIITVYELGFEGEQLFMAMELLDGIDLKHALAGRRMSVEQGLNVMEQICEGLAFAHSQGVVHRDLKPANIHILPNGKVKIMDFGLARLSGSEMTTTGMVMGTPHYMSPEQVRGQKADARSDVFALGCVLYELFAGRKPFDAESMHAVLFKIMQEEPVPLREAAPGTPEPLVHLVERALAKNPAERFQNASELLAGIRQARLASGTAKGTERAPGERTALGLGTVRPGARDRGPGSAASRSSPAASRRKRWPLFAALGLVLAAILGGGWALRSRVLGPVAPAPSPPPEISPLARQAIESQVELARRKIDDGELADAVTQAEGALSLDPANAAARRLRDEAQAALQKIDEAVKALRAAGQDRGRLASAAFDLMKLAPAHPEAEAAANAAGSLFRPRADEARRIEQQARREAEQASAGGSLAFAEGADLERQGDRALAEGQPVTAARRFLEARGRFERSRRAPR